MGMAYYSEWRSLRELDESAAAPKGSAFRAFKARVSELVEGNDFIVLDHQTHAALASELHARGLLYRSSVHPVLLSPSAAALIADALRHL